MDRVPSTESSGSGVSTAAKLAVATACAATGFLIYQRSNTKESQDVESTKTVVHNLQVTEKTSPDKTIYEVNCPGQTTKTIVHNVQITEQISPGKTTYESSHHDGQKMVTEVVTSRAGTLISMQMNTAHAVDPDARGEIEERQKMDTYESQMREAREQKRLATQAQAASRKPIADVTKAVPSDRLKRCTHVDGKNDDYSFVMSMLRCCNTLAKAKPCSAVYTKEIPRNFEDRTRLRSFDRSVLRFAERYIDAYKSYGQVKEEDAYADIFMLAVGIVDQCAAYMQDPEAHGRIAPFARLRNVFINHIMRQTCILEFYEHIDEFKTIQDIHDMFKQLLDYSVTDPSFVFAIDIAMFHIVHRAAIDTKDKPDKFEGIAKEYIVSALAQLAYSPYDEQRTHLRTYTQKATCMKQMHVYSHLFGLILESAVFLPSSQAQKAQVANTIQTMLGHATMLTYLSQSDYILKTILYKADYGMSSSQYIQEILDASKSITPEKVEANLLYIVEQGVSGDKFKVYIKLYAQVIGHAVNYDQRLCDKLKQLYEEVRALSPDDCTMLKALTFGMIPEIPQEGQCFGVLEKIWDFERSLYESYVKHHDLDIGQLYCSTPAERLMQKVLYLKTDEFDVDDVIDLEKTFSSYFLNKHNDPNLRSYTGALVELCDPDNRLDRLFVINTNKSETTAYLSSSALQAARECAKKAKELSGFTAERRA